MNVNIKVKLADVENVFISLNNSKTECCLGVEVFYLYHLSHNNNKKRKLLCLSSQKCGKNNLFKKILTFLHSGYIMEGQPINHK